MSRDLVVNNNVHTFPEHGDAPSDTFWGENVTEWAQDVTDVLGTLINAYDVLDTTITLVDGASNTLVPELSFDSSAVKSVVIDFVIIRGAGTYVEEGELRMVIKGSTWYQSIRTSGPDATDVTFGMSGDTLTYSAPQSYGGGQFKFRAKVILV